MSTTIRSPSRSSRSPSCGPLYAPRTDGRPGKHAHVFRPPQTPGIDADRRHSSFQTPRYAVGTASSSRKRARPSSGRASLATPSYTAVTPASPWTNVSSAESSIMRSDCASPPPLANVKYTIAGGLDTPTQTAESYFGRDYNDIDLGVTRRWRDMSITTTSENQTEEAPVILGGDRNGQGRHHTSPNGSPKQSWGNFVFTVVGGVAGKMWEFCKAGAFTGFYAGGGKGYDINQPEEGQIRRRSTWEDVDESRTIDRYDRSATPVPGQYPEEDDIEWPSARPAKRQHTDNGKGWVMVPDGLDYSTPASRTSRRITTAGTPTAARPAPTSRRSLVPVSRRTSGISHTASSAVQRPAMTPHKRSTSDVTPMKTTPLSPEAQRYIVEKRREERQADASIRRLNDQLKAMIKEGREALGTKIDIVEDVQMEDEGYFEQR